MRLNAPRGLKEPLACNSSSFSVTSQGVPSALAGRRSNGVRRICGAMRWAASRIAVASIGCVMAGQGGAAGR
jgi:hypothetical protein